MTYIIDYFDLNKRATIIQAKSTDLIEQLMSSKKSELNLEIPNTANKAQHPSGLKKTRVKQEIESEDQDPLYSAMEQYWTDNDRRESSDRRNTDRRSFSIKRKWLSLKLHPKSPMPWWSQITLYSGIVLGAIITSTVIEHLPGTIYTFKISLPFVMLSSFLAIIISPVAFEKLCMNVTGSFFTRFFLFIQNGAFWYILLSAFSFTLIQLANMGA